jgi:hypothetical protein
MDDFVFGAFVACEVLLVINWNPFDFGIRFAELDFSVATRNIKILIRM